MNLDGKQIIVTGAASGIGAETAKLIKESGGTVIGVDLNKPAKNVDLFIQADLSVPDSIERASDQIPAGIDGLCNIAGLPPTHAPASVVKVNFLGLRQLTEKLISKMNQNASIVNVASLAGIDWPKATERVTALFNLTDFDTVEAFCEQYRIIGGESYFLTKEALIVWSMMNRWTWRDAGIRMNSVSPGPVETPILPDFLETLGDRAEEDAKIMDRPGRPDDIAPVITFLLSDVSGWIRGANIPVDGGMFAHVQCHQYGYES